MSTKNLKVASGLDSSTVNIATVPVGTIMPFAGPTTAIPSGWLLCDGTTYSSATYPLLYAILGSTTRPNAVSRVITGAASNANVGTNGSSTTSHSVTYPSGGTLTAASADHNHAIAAANSDYVGHYHNHDTNSYAIFNTYASNGANKAGNAQGNLVARDHNHYAGAYWTTGNGAYLAHSHYVNASNTNSGNSTSHNHSMGTSNAANTNSTTFSPPVRYIHFIIKAA